MKRLSIILFLLITLTITAQDNFTEKLQRLERGKGQVILFQSDLLTRLVNNQENLTAKTDSFSSSISSFMPTVKHERRGYRIQVFAGGNSRISKNEAEEMKLKVMKIFTSLDVYTSFISPRWVCRVGNFASYQEAAAMMRRMKEKSEFKELSVVRTMIELNY